MFACYLFSNIFSLFSLVPHIFCNIFFFHFYCHFFYYCALSLPSIYFVPIMLCVFGNLSLSLYLSIQKKTQKILSTILITKRCVQILKSSRQITMTVRGPTSLHGFGPPPPSTSDIFKSSPMTGALLSPPSRQTCSWIDRHGRPASPPYDFEGRRSDRRER